MSSGRAAKRARHKERRADRRSAIRSAVRRRRRQRLLVVGITSLVLVAVGSALAFVAFRDEAEPEATPRPTPGAPVAAPTPQPVACGAELPPTAGSEKRSYDSDADQALDPDKRYVLRLQTSCGTIDIELTVDDNPVTANSVVFLAREGFYDGLVFHRIVSGFVIQGGDPEGTGRGGPGYQTVEVAPIETKYTNGVVAMAKAQDDPPGTAGSQFFIVTGEDASLPPDYAVLGKVTAGMDVAERIEALGPGGEAAPSEWVYIERATVIEE